MYYDLKRNEYVYLDRYFSYFKINIFFNCWIIYNLLGNYNYIKIIRFWFVLLVLYDKIYIIVEIEIVWLMCKWNR